MFPDSIQRPHTLRMLSNIAAVFKGRMPWWWPIKADETGTIAIWSVRCTTRLPTVKLWQGGRRVDWATRRSGTRAKTVPNEKSFIVFNFDSKEKKFFLFFVGTAHCLVYCGTVQNLHKSVFWPLEFFKPLGKASFVWFATPIDGGKMFWNSITTSLADHLIPVNTRTKANFDFEQLIK